MLLFVFFKWLAGFLSLETEFVSCSDKFLKFFDWLVVLLSSPVFVFASLETLFASEFVKEFPVIPSKFFIVVIRYPLK